MAFEGTADVEKQRTTISEFWKAIDIWLRNPHTVNRRILMSYEILTSNVRSADLPKIFERIETLDIEAIYSSKSTLSSSEESETETAIASEAILSGLGISEYPGQESSDDEARLQITKLLPRNAQLFSPVFQFTVIEKALKRITCVPRSISLEKKRIAPRSSYTISYTEDSRITITVLASGTKELLDDPSTEWLERTLLPRLLAWARNDDFELPARNASLSSLSLVSGERYAKCYAILKEKYGSAMVKNWPENTDPAKFVYEDIAIAAYLLTLWQKERWEKGGDERLQTFLDLGCGNGLLVYILSSEGHSGTGIDLRKRKIWDYFPHDTKLQVRTIVPSSGTVYPDVDWIIGNHSDELTPWIPVIAARSSPYTRYFLLPCCAYEFDGAKYQRRCASKSQYSEYIEYVRDISEKCGFTTLLDRLRIPSTKRVCLIGWKRHVDARHDPDLLESRIRDLISAKTTLVPAETDEERSAVWSCGFRPRDPLEKARNCTQLDEELIASIVRIVAADLLLGGRVVTLEEIPERRWNAGRTLPIAEIARSIPQDTLARLRKEYGGLQTLLRNHAHVFNVSRGQVEFRIPGRENLRRNRRRKRRNRSPRRKTKPCWFNDNHPDGCPVTEVKCDFRH